MREVEEFTRWESRLSKELQSIDVLNRQNAGALLQVIPHRTEWEEFLKVIRSVWLSWKEELSQYPASLMVLYCGLAFYEYEDGKFWPHFGNAVGINSSPPTNQQTEINKAYSRAAAFFKFPIQQKIEKSHIKTQEGVKLPPERTRPSYVGLAIRHIGIPLSLWEGFLEICKWAGWTDEWTSLPDDEWSIAVEKRSGSRSRIKNFLIDNRQIASEIIKELLEARKILGKETKWAVDDLSQACLLRVEYFEEVPETAEFLRPTASETLIRDRAQLIWDNRKNQIRLNLPGVQQSKLPATWCLDHFNQPASRSPDELILNSLAFQSFLNLKLESGSSTDAQKLRGINPWGLFDLDCDGRLVNTGREHLPLHSYALVSPEPLTKITREGFEDDDWPLNSPFELTDGKHCFVTYLWPTGEYAELGLSHKEERILIRFRRNLKIQARFFVGRKHQAAYFERLSSDKVKIEGLPVLCLVIPREYFKDNEMTLNEMFRVHCDGRSTGGKWESLADFTEKGDKEYYIWRWGNKPFLDWKPGKTKSFKDLQQFTFSPDIKGDRVFSVETPAFNVSYKVYLDHQKTGMDDCWGDLPGAFLPWFLICQAEEGLTWEDLQLAREIIAPKDYLSAPLLRKYEKEGLLIQKGRRWMITESRATINELGEGDCIVQFCGNPSILWGLYRKMHVRRYPLADIKVINKRGELPFLQMIWDRAGRHEIQNYFRKHKVAIGDALWNH